MNFYKGQVISMDSDYASLVYPNGNQKLMVVIDKIAESERIFKWINDYNKHANFTWIVLFAESDLSDSYMSQLHEKFQVADKLGVEKIFCLRTGDTTTLLKIAVANNITHIICSKSIKRRMQLFLFGKDFLKRLRNLNGEIDIFYFNVDDHLKQGRNTIVGNI